MITIKSGKLSQHGGPLFVGQKLLWGEFRIAIVHLDGSIEDYGVVSRKTVTIVAITELLNVLIGGTSAALPNFHYHGVGIGITPESSSDTALGNELTVGIRGSGTQQKGGPGQYVTAATITSTFSANITEVGVFSSPTDGVLLDRGRTAPIPVDVGEQILSSFTLSIVGS